MLFSSISFLYLFLPIACLLYFISPKKYRNYTLVLLSVFFYFFGEPIYVLLLLFSSISDYCHSLYIERYRGTKKAKYALVSSIVINLGMLFFFKYLNFFIATINTLGGLSIPLQHIPLPIGISFFTFQTMSYSIDVYRGTIKAERNFVTLASFVTLFPQLIAGPIVRYSDIEEELQSRNTNLDTYYSGIRRFILGLAQKVIIANSLGEFVEIFKHSNDQSTLFFWAYAAAFSLQIYFDFAAYSNMAIALGKLLGFSFPENFNYPFISRSITEFWQRWHMTLSLWFRDYLYIPLGGNKKGVARQIVNIVIVWSITGLWHGAQYNFILWGMYFAILLVVEKFILRNALLKLPRVFQHLYLLFVLAFSFVIFDSNSLSEISYYVSGLLGLDGLPFLSYEAAYYISSYAVVFLLACLFATPLPKQWYKRLETKRYSKEILTVLETPLMAVLLILSTAYIVDGSFNPFLYFRF